MGFFNSAKTFFGLESDSREYEDEDYVEEEDYEEERPKVRRNFNNRNTQRNETFVKPISNQNEITVITLSTFEEAMSVADILKADKPVIFSVIELEKGEAERVVDLITGAAHALDGNFERVSGGIFLATPNDMGIVIEKYPKRSKSTVNINN